MRNAVSAQSVKAVTELSRIRQRRDYEPHFLVGIITVILWLLKNLLLKITNSVMLYFPSKLCSRQTENDYFCVIGSRVLLLGTTH
jgi:hypothetical protein